MTSFYAHTFDAFSRASFCEHPRALTPTEHKIQLFSRQADAPSAGHST